MKKLRRFMKKSMCNRGSISVFLCITLAGIIFFNSILVDSARLLTFDKLLQQRLNLSVNSLLADFYSKLKEDYGLYGMYVTDASSAKNDVYNYMNAGNNFFDLKSLSYGSEYRQLGLMSYDVKNIKINYNNNLTEPEILSGQITDIMKYKTPANIFEHVIDQIDMFSSSVECSDMYLMYKEASSLREKAEKSVETLKVNVEGNELGSLHSVNGWNQFGRNMYKTQINVLNTAPYIINEDGSADASAGLKSFEVLIVVIRQYKGYNLQALENIRAIDVLNNEIDKKVKEFEKWIENNEPENEVEEAYCEMLSGEIKSLKTFSTRVSYNVERGQLNNNIEIFNKMESSCIDGISYIKNTESECLTKDKIMNYVKKTNIERNIKTNFSIKSYQVSTDKSLADYDKTKEKDNALSKLFNVDEDIVISDEQYNLLPSVEKKLNKNSVLSGMFDNISSWCSISSNDSKISGVLPSIESIGTGVINSAYLNDYIMTYFYSTMDNSQSRDYFFESEIEYIIAGNKSQKENIAEVTKQILAIRFVMNLIHVVTDEKKVGFANEIGTAISSATSGIGGPVYAFIIMSTWALTESAIDVANLLRGESVPFFKSPGDWNLDIGLKNIGSVYLENISDSEISDSTTSKDSVMNMGYNDYLRILIMFVSDDIKLARVSDLIQLNISLEHDDSFALSDVYTGVVCDCTIGVSAMMKSEKKKRSSYEMFFKSDAIY